MFGHVTDVPVQMEALLERLPQDERDVLDSRMGLDRGRPREFSEVAEHLGIDPQTAEEIENRALSRFGVLRYEGPSLSED